jgi:hypothetical protein
MDSRFRGNDGFKGACLAYAFRERHHFLLLLTQPGNPQAQLVALLQEALRLRPSPTPGGVPVVMMSPGSSVMKRDR